MPVEDLPPTRSARLATFAEIVLILMLCFVRAGTPPPDVNEAHYLAKAKHYWNPEWCAADHFLETADAHLVFYWTFGWLTRLASFTTVAWVGRFVTWGLLAWSWQRLSRAILPGSFMSVLSAALFMLLVEWGHMAGEWIIGGVEAKGFAYVLLLLAIESLVRNRWERSMVLCGAAAAFHVLVGGWGMVAVAIAWLFANREERSGVARMFVAGLAGVALSLPGLIPGLALTWSLDEATIREANRIYVFDRLSHHLVFHELAHIFIARHAFLMLVVLVSWKWFGRSSRVLKIPANLFRFVLASIAIAVAGAVLDQLLLYAPETAAAVLRYYWFRMSDVVTPLGVTFVLLAMQKSLLSNRPMLGVGALSLILATISIELGWIAVEHRLDPRPRGIIQANPADYLATEEKMRRWREWQQVCRWIDENTLPTDVFLTPRNQQTFKWYANRAEVVTGKDVPQDAVGIVQWRRRIDEIFPYTVRYADLVAHGEPRLRELSKKYGFRYIVVDRSASSGQLSFPRLFPSKGEEAVYEVYRVPSDD